MAKVASLTGGTFKLGTGVDPDSIFDGTQLDNVTLTIDEDILADRAIEDTTDEVTSLGRSFTIEGEYFLQDDDTGGFLAVGARSGVGTYTDQGGTAVFVGEVRLVSAGDVVRKRSYAMQRFRYVNNGVPTTPAS